MTSPKPEYLRVRSTPERKKSVAIAAAQAGKTIPIFVWEILDAHLSKTKPTEQKP